jgi:hypothetical protein
MVDDPLHAGYDDGRRTEAPFLSRALEAVLRLVEVYAAERDIQTHRDPVYPADPLLGAVARAHPISRVDAPTAASPSTPSTRVEPPGTVAQSSHEPAGRGDPAKNGHRGGWTKGNSTSAQIRAGAVEYLRQKRARASGREIWGALKAKGVVITAKDPSALVSSRIGRSPLFDHTYEGYGLVEWSKGSGAPTDGRE